MLKKLLWMWIKGSAALVALLILSLVLKTGAQPFVEASSPTLSWILSFLIALTPLGALGGYLVIFIVQVIISAIFGSSKKESTREIPSHTRHCPFAGSIYFTKDYDVFGRTWESGKEALKIEGDWSIISFAHGVIGWIDVAGDIHDNVPLLGEIDPEARLSGGSTGLKVVNRSIWAGSQKVGYVR